MLPELKTVLWIAAAKKDLEDLPSLVIKEFGYALYQAQRGDYPDIAKTMGGFGSAEVIELKENDPAGLIELCIRSVLRKRLLFYMSSKKRAQRD